RRWLEERRRADGWSEDDLRAWRDSWEEATVWSGPAAELKEFLEDRTGERFRKQRSWPKEARWFGRKVKQAQEPMREGGWDVEFPRTSQQRLIVIRRIDAWPHTPPDLDRAPQGLSLVGPDRLSG
ncbi:hypothetical protein ACFL3S_13005, partial [Gemmatimonadota bacterium]